MISKVKRKKIIVGNWKMNPVSPEEVKKIVSGIKKVAYSPRKVDVVLCPPFMFFEMVSKLLKNTKVLFGSQDISGEEKGSFTGQISASMILSLGGKYSIVGHSERRKEGEDDVLVNKKIMRAIQAGITPIVCIGELVRDDHGEYLSFLEKQIKAVFSGITKEFVSKVVIAYEPVWAIGKTEAMSPHDIYETSLYVRKVLSQMYGMETSKILSILYGGSVTSDSAVTILNEGNVDGLLIGRQSLVPEDFSKIISYANTL